MPTSRAVRKEPREGVNGSQILRQPSQMKMKNPSFTWEKLQDVYYRSRNLSDLKWPAQSGVKHAMSTTLIAIELEEVLQIYDYQGHLEGNLNKRDFPDILTFEFDQDENLVVVMPEAVVNINNWSPLEFTRTPLPEDLQDIIWDYKKGLVITRKKQDVYTHRDNKFELVCKNEGQYTLLTKSHWNANNQKAVLLDVNHVFELDIEGRILKKALPESQWHKVFISPKGLVCIYSAKFNKFQVYSDPSRVLLEHSLDETPQDLRWCGDDSIACSFSDEVRLYGPNNSYVTFWYPNEITALYTESDGLKVFTEEDIKFISRVPEYTSNAFRVGSTESAAILLDSLELLDTNISRAIENLKIIDLEKAVRDCLNSAEEEFDPYFQKKLLNAASFGKASLPYKSFDSNVFVQACDTIRLLNLLRGIGIFLTLPEFKEMTINGLINRLLVRHKHYQAILICKITDNKSLLPHIFSSWSITKIHLSPDLEDDELLKQIKLRLSEVPIRIEGHLANVAHAAFLEGRFRLARELALLECSLDLKISELLDLDDDSLALSESLKAMCPELTLSLLLNLRSRLTKSQLTKLLIMNMRTEQLYPYFQRRDQAFLFDYYRQEDRFTDLAQLLLNQGKQHGSVRSFLPQVQELYSKVMNDALIKQDTELIQRQEKLWLYQESLSTKFGHDFIELTLDETLYKLLDLKQERQAQDLVKKFKVSDKKLYHVKCKCLVNKKAFDELYDFAITKKSPIGYQPFYDYLRRSGYSGEAVNYVSLISGTTYEQKKEMYIQCKGYYEAMQLAGKEKDIPGLKELYKLIPANEPRLKAQINEIMSKI